MTPKAFKPAFAVGTLLAAHLLDLVTFLVAVNVVGVRSSGEIGLVASVAGGNAAMFSVIKVVIPVIVGLAISVYSGTNYRLAKWVLILGVLGGLIGAISNVVASVQVISYVP